MHAASCLSLSLRTVEGSVSQDVKDTVATWATRFGKENLFGNSISARLEATEMAVYEPVDEPDKKQARIVFEIDVTEDMCNTLGNLHGGCIATLIDMCSSLTLPLLAQHVDRSKIVHVSVSLNTTFHAPIPLGCRLKIVNETLSFGNRAATAKTEIFDKTHGRLAASGVHVKMVPSVAKL
ncbi:HotDog domain-containing protein [Cytidiella melzeri]|nr:HotDog domain-containing protein [Cytidiella melzeri]